MIKLVIGFLFGFCIFLLNTTSVGNIYFRTNSEGTVQFTFDSLIEYLKAPLNPHTSKFLTLWGFLPHIDIFSRLKFLALNWIAMSVMGIILFQNIF